MFSSDIVYLKNENSNIITTLVYPNPTSDNIMLIADDVNPVLQYIITDYEGRTITEAHVGPYTDYSKECKYGAISFRHIYCYIY